MKGPVPEKQPRRRRRRPDEEPTAEQRALELFNPGAEAPASAPARQSCRSPRTASGAEARASAPAPAEAQAPGSELPSGPAGPGTEEPQPATSADMRAQQVAAEGPQASDRASRSWNLGPTSLRGQGLRRGQDFAEGLISSQAVAPEGWNVGSVPTRWAFHSVKCKGYMTVYSEFCLEAGVAWRSDA